MFGLSIRAWIVDSDSDDDFSLVLSHNQNMKHFLPALLELLESEFSLDKVTTAFLEKVTPSSRSSKLIRNYSVDPGAIKEVPCENLQAMERGQDDKESK